MPFVDRTNTDAPPMQLPSLNLKTDYEAQVVMFYSLADRLGRQESGSAAARTTNRLRKSTAPTDWWARKMEILPHVG